MRKTCLDMVYKLALADRRIVFIGSDLGFGTLDEFKRDMPDRFFMEGVAEQNVVGMAAGLAMEGAICYVNTIATFLTRRSYEQVLLDLALHNVRVRLIGNGGGLVYAPLGPTHLAFEDIALMRAAPNMTILAPADAEEMKRLMPETVDHEGPIYIRLGKGGDPVVTGGWGKFVVGRAVEAHAGRDALIVTTGVMLSVALEAAERLKSDGVEACVLHMPTVKPFDAAAVLEHAAHTPVVVSLEEHVPSGGLGGAVAETLAEADFRTPRFFRRLCLPDAFPDQYGSQAGLWERYGLTPANVAAVIHGLRAKAAG